MVNTDLSQPPKRKMPFETVIPFTVASLKAAVQMVQEHGYDGVQFNCKTDPGLLALVYPSGLVALYSRYSFHKRPTRIRLGELGLITVEQARQKHRAIRVQVAEGGNPKAPKPNIITYAEFHHQHYILKGKANQKKSLAADESRFKHWLEPAFGKISLGAITDDAIDALKLKMQGDGKSPATIKNVLLQLSAALQLAVDKGLIAKNPAKLVKMPRLDNKKSDYLNPEQAGNFMRAARARPEVLASRMLILLLLTGARLGEAQVAKWEDIDLKAGIWTLPTQKSGKRGKIFLSEVAKEILSEIAMVKRNEYVFPGERGNDVLSRPIKVFKRICADAGIGDGYRIHSLRHTWCSLAINAGVNIEIVSQGARHSAPEVTRRYSHAYDASLLAANETVANILMAKVVGA